MLIYDTLVSILLASRCENDTKAVLTHWLNNLHMPTPNVLDQQFNNVLREWRGFTPIYGEGMPQTRNQCKSLGNADTGSNSICSKFYGLFEADFQSRAFLQLTETIKL